MHICRYIKTYVFKHVSKHISSTSSHAASMDFPDYLLSFTAIIHRFRYVF